MLVFAPVPAFSAPPFRHAPASTAYSNVDYFDAVAEQAAQEYALATARLEAAQRQRERAQQQRYLQQVARRQAALDQYYREQYPLVTTSFYNPTLGPTRLSPIQTIEEERRRLVRARQREVQQAFALAQTRQHQEADIRMRARLEAQRLREANPGFNFMDFGAPASSRAANAPQQSRASSSHSCASACAARPATTQPQPRVDDVTDNALYAALAEYLTQLTASDAPSQPVDRKGKGKAVDVPVEPTPVAAPVPATQQSESTLSFKEELETRMRTETDPEVQEALVKLYSDIFSSFFQPHEAQFVQGPSAPRREKPSGTATSSASPAAQSQPTSAAPAASDAAATEGAQLHRTPALPPVVAERLLKFYHARRARKLSLAQISTVEDALRKLQSTFEFPARLDFVNPIPANDDSEEPGPLAYTPNNTVIHAYEHALSELLTQLDAVESNGDLAVRGRRKEVVREVELALEAVERRVEESRERERERSRERRRSVASSPAPSTPASDVEATPAVAEKSETSVEVTESAPELVVDVPETVVLVDTPVVDTPAVEAASVDIAPASPDQEDVEVSSVETDLSAPADTPATVTNDTPAATEAELAPTSALTDTTEVPEADSVSVALIDVDTSSPVAEAEESKDSAPSTPIDIDDLVSPIAPSEPSDATFTTAPSTFPPTAIPTPEAISRAPSSSTNTTFVTADPDSASASPVDIAPEPMTRTPSEARSESTAGETFLLSSTPLADEPKKARAQPQQAAEDADELEVISKEDAEPDAAKSDSEWSDVDAA